MLPSVSFLCAIVHVKCFTVVTIKTELCRQTLRKKTTRAILIFRRQSEIQRANSKNRAGVIDKDAKAHPIDLFTSYNAKLTRSRLLATFE